ncbi:hypothetical protein [Bartonella fuyuanensis]
MLSFPYTIFQFYSFLAPGPYKMSVWLFYHFSWVSLFHFVWGECLFMHCC